MPLIFNFKILLRPPLPPPPWAPSNEAVIFVMVVILLVCGVLSAVDMTFTPMNVLRAVREVKNTDRLGECLGVPGSKQDEIERQFSSEAQQRKAYINYFIEHDPEASWRSVICVLDEMDQPDSVEAADNIRHLAEAVPGRAGS